MALKRTQKIWLGVGIGMVAISIVGIIAYNNRSEKNGDAGSDTDDTNTDTDGDNRKAGGSGGDSNGGGAGAGSALSDPTKRDNINTWKGNKPALKELCGRRIYIKGDRKDAWLACIARGGIEG